MPIAYYVPICGHGGGASLTSSPTCSDCGARNEFSGWRFGTHEGMARYQYVYGLKPIGPHRRMTDELLGPERNQCHRCGGLGILTVSPEQWRGCPDCEETGGFWKCSPERVDYLRQQILDAFPDAGVPRPTGRFTGTLAVNLRTSTVVDLQELSEKEEADDADDESEDIGDAADRRFRLGRASREFDSELERIVELGSSVYRLDWDGGGPGAGAGTESVMLLDGKYAFASGDFGWAGPYSSLREVIDHHENLLWVSEATTSVECTELTAQDLVAILKSTRPGLTIEINGDLWRSTDTGWSVA